MNNVTCLLALLLGTIGLQVGIAQAAPESAVQDVRPGHLRLMDNLDRPQDGYCLDILGSGQYIRFDMPMSAHNCKPGLYMDEAVVLEKNGRIRFPAYDACATVAGINKSALAGAVCLVLVVSARPSLRLSIYSILPFIQMVGLSYRARVCV